MLIDGTPLLGQRTGIGRYTAALAEELASIRRCNLTARQKSDLITRFGLT